MTLPVIYNMAAYRGDSWSQAFRLLRNGAPVNLNGAVIEAEARDGKGAKNDLVLTVIDGIDGRFQVELPPASLPPSTYYYDVEVTAGGETTTWIKGSLTVWRDVTNELPTP